MRTDGPKKLRVMKRNMQRAIATHRNPADAARCAPRLRAVATLDEGHEFPQEEILVSRAPIVGIDVKRRTARGCHDQEFDDAMLLPKILDQAHSAGAK